MKVDGLSDSEWTNEDMLNLYKSIDNLESQNGIIDEQNRELETLASELSEYKRILLEAIKDKLKKEEKPDFVKVLLKKK